MREGSVDCVFEVLRAVDGTLVECPRAGGGRGQVASLSDVCLRIGTDVMGHRVVYLRLATLDGKRSGSGARDGACERVEPALEGNDETVGLPLPDVLREGLRINVVLDVLVAWGGALKDVVDSVALWVVGLVAVSGSSPFIVCVGREQRVRLRKVLE